MGCMTRSVPVYRRINGNIVFDHLIECGKPKPQIVKANGFHHLAEVGEEPNEIQLPPRFAALAQCERPHSDWYDCGSMRDWYKPRTWKSWRNDQHR